MRKNFETPKLNISHFNKENIVTTSGTVIASVKDELMNTDGAITLDGKNGENIKNVLIFTW